MLNTDYFYDRCDVCLGECAFMVHSPNPCQSQTLQLGLPHGRQGPKHLSQHLPPSMHLSREPLLEAEGGLDPRCSDMG